MQLEVIDIKGKKTGRQVELPAEIFGATPNDHVIYLAVKQYLAARRSGTHKVKTRAEVQGASRKLHKQKGTGGSRKGRIKSPVFRGGGRIFGPQPRDYNFKLNKKMKALARMSALSYKAKNNDIVVLEDFTFETPKTKNFINLVINLKLNNTKALMVTANIDENLYLSSRNLQKSKVITASDINTYDLLHADKLVLTASSVKSIEDSFSK